MWNQSQRRIAHLPTDVYRVHDQWGKLLYVGSSINVFKRMQEHQAYAEWWPYASTGTVTRYENRRMARKVEALAIRDEKPMFNVTREVSEERNADPITDPIEVLSLFWEQGRVWVDADAPHQNNQT